MTFGGGLTVITGPSGVGKGSLVREILSHHSEIWLSVSATTRNAREGEIDGEHYFFVDRLHFTNLANKNGFLEWAEFAGNFYGTPRKEVIQKIESGLDVLLEIELEGARQIRKSFPNALQIFIAPPSFSELENRIRNRGTESEQSIKTRLRRGEEELKAQKEFNAIVVNDELKRASKEIMKLMKLDS